jgi:hypothetical protein
VSGMGNEVQARAIAEQVAEAAVAKFGQMHPPAPPKAEVPPPLKWAGGIVASIFAVGTAALFFWMVSTLSALQQTVTRIDERQQLNGDNLKDRLGAIEGRLMRVEQQKDGGRS